MPGDIPTPRHEDLRVRLVDALGDRYEIRGVVGAGATSVVFRAQDRKYRRPVAIKLLRPDHRTAVNTERFLREVRISASLEHPSIVPVFDSGEVDGLPYFIMPFFEGESLDDRLDRVGSLPLEDAVRIVRDIGDALGLAHRNGILHRDVKPGNILLIGGRAALTDFGVARALNPTGSPRTTTAGVAIGTPAYMSPEQAGGDSSLTEAVDQYGLACVLFEMLAGEPVFGGATSATVLAQQLTAAPRPIRTVRPEVPEGVERALLRALAKSPGERYASVEEFVGAVERGVETTASGWRAARFPLAVGVAAVVAVVGLVLWRPGAPPAWSGAPESLAVLAMAPEAATPEERSLSVELADQIARELNRWDSVRAVGFAALWSDAMERGIRGPALEDAAHGVSLARRASLRAVLGVTVRPQGDSALVDAILYDASSGRAVDHFSTTGDPSQSLTELVHPVVTRILGVDAQARLRPGTSSRDAWIAEDLGTRALLRGRLDEARGHFAEAVDHDSTWSVALTHLALTEYLESFIAGGGAGVDSGSDIARWATRATERAGELNERERRFVMGFYHLQDGRYEESRELFRELVRSDSTDVLAWLMVGLVEMEDRSLVPDASGRPVPASDLNVAREAFRRTVALRPTFELGYVTSARIHDLARSAITRGCSVFVQPGAAADLPEELESLEDRPAFCPLVDDSIRWVPFPDFSRIPTSELYAGADRLFQESVGDLERWAAFAVESPEPRHELARARLTERARLRLAPPAQLRSLALAALRYERDAQALQTDTSAAELVLLANLLLAADSLEASRDAIGRALALHEACAPECRFTRAALNVPLATGAATTVRQLVNASETQRFVERPDGSIVGYGGAERHRDRIRALASVGVGSAVMREEFQAMDSVWRSLGYPRRDRELLRNDVLPQIAVAVVGDPTLVHAWEPGWTPADPVWLAVTGSAGGGGPDPEMVRRLAAGEGFLPRAERAYILGVLAGRMGEPSRAVRYLGRLDSLALGVADPDMGWGLRTLSYHLRAVELDKLGRSQEAADLRMAFLRAWSTADPLNADLREAAGGVPPGGTGP